MKRGVERQGFQKEGCKRQDGRRQVLEGRDG
jgi:hypothetical protein